MRKGGIMESLLSETIIKKLEDEYKYVHIEEEDLGRGKKIHLYNKKNQTIALEYFLFPDMFEIVMLRQKKSSGPFVFSSLKCENKYIFRILASLKLKFYNEVKEVIVNSGGSFVSYGIKDKEQPTEFLTDNMVFLYLAVNKEYLEQYKYDKNIKKFLFYFKNKLVSFKDKCIDDIPSEALDAVKRMLIYGYEIDITKELELFGKANVLLSSLIKAFVEKKSFFENDKENLVEIIKKVIENDYESPDVLKTLPEKFYINRVTLLKKFQQETGMNLQDYTKKIRLEKSYELLINSKILISEISEKVGYKNSGYFSMIFKEYFGVSPKEVRKEKYRILREKM